MVKQTSTVIIGAGLTGLSAAYHLSNNYILLEKEDRIGGLCRSITIDGFTFDHSIHILYTTNQYAASLIKNVLLKGNLISQQRESWVYSKGVYTEFPFQANTYGLPPEVIVECIMGLIKAKHENGYPTPPKNFKEWIYCTFGEGVAKHFMIPYNKKVWAIDPALMDFGWIAERVPQPSIESILLGALQPAQKKIGFNNDFWYPKEGGIEALPRGFLPYLKNLNLNSIVTKIYAKNRKLVIKRKDHQEDSLGYDRIISTLPLPVIIQLLDEVPEGVRKATIQLQGNSVYAVNIGIQGEVDPACYQKLSVNPRKFHWIYFPEESFTLHRLSFPKNFSPSMCPDGMSSIQVEVSCSHHRPVDKNTLFDVVTDELYRAGILRSNNKIVLKHIMTLSPAYVIYDLNHRKNVNLIIEFLKGINIYSCGRFGQWEYLNMDHSILSGKKAAEWIKTKSHESPADRPTINSIAGSSHE